MSTQCLNNLILTFPTCVFLWKTPKRSVWCMLRDWWVWPSMATIRCIWLIVRRLALSLPFFWLGPRPPLGGQLLGSRQAKCGQIPARPCLFLCDGVLFCNCNMTTSGWPSQNTCFAGDDAAWWRPGNFQLWKDVLYWVTEWHTRRFTYVEAGLGQLDRLELLIRQIDLLEDRLNQFCFSFQNKCFFCFLFLLHICFYWRCGIESLLFSST